MYTKLMKVREKLSKLTIFLIIATIMLLRVKNKSNVPSLYIVPIIVALAAKYVVGDLDKGVAWTWWDIAFWIYAICVPYLVIQVSLLLW